MGEQHREDKIVKLCSTGELVEYTLLKDALGEAGIDCMDTPHVDSAYDDLFVPSRGYADVYVFKSDLSKAKKVLASLKDSGKIDPDTKSDESPTKRE